MDAQGQPVKDEKGNPVTEKQVVESQTIVQGPMASQVRSRCLGTNGGGTPTPTPPTRTKPDAALQFPPDLLDLLIRAASPITWDAW